MRRLGFEHKDFEELCDLLTKYPLLKPVSCFTHLAGADDAIHQAFSEQQLAAFRELAMRLEAFLDLSLLSMG